MVENLTKKTLHGLKWSYIGSFTNAVFQIGFAAVLARLLEPAAFGLMAMSGLMLGFGQYFAQMGMGAAIIQKNTLTPEEIRASFTITFFLGIVFYTIMYLLAPFAKQIFNSVEVVPVIKVMALTFIFNGTMTTSLNLLQRDLNYKILSISEIVSYIFGYGFVGVYFAFQGYGVWSLVIAVLSQSVCKLFIVYFNKKHSLFFTFNFNYYKSLLSYGVRISISSFVIFLTSMLDTLAIGRFLGSAELGLYNRSRVLIDVPIKHSSENIIKIIFPTFSKINNNVKRLKRGYLSVTLITSVILFVICSGIFVAAPEIVRVVLGDKWLAAISILQILSIGILFRFVSVIDEIICRAIGKLKMIVILQVLYMLFLIILLAAFFKYGLIGFTWAISISFIVRYLLYFFAVKKALNITFIEYFKIVKSIIISGGFVGIVFYLIISFLRAFQLIAWQLLIIEMFVGGSLLFLSFFFSIDRTLRNEVAMRFSQLDIKLKHGSFFSKCITCYQRYFLRNLLK